MAVTSIQVITNVRGSSILFINTENSGNNREVESNTPVGVGNCWIPWCFRSSDFPAHHIEIIDTASDRVLWFIWQQRNPDAICASTTGFVDPDGPHIDGDSRTGRSYFLFIGPNDDQLKAGDFQS